MDEINDFLDVVVGLRLFAKDAHRLFTLNERRLADRVNDGQGEFALLNVVVFGLADDAGLLVVEEVVLDLERHSYQHSKILHLGDCLLACAATVRARLAARRNECAGLFADDVVIRFLVDIEAVSLFQLFEFALRHLPDGL